MCRFVHVFNFDNSHSYITLLMLCLDEDESMYAYLVSRNVGDEVIQRMRSELVCL